MSFFQSPIRKHIKTIIYGEEGFAITLFDQEYFGIKKSKSIGPVSISRYQVLGVTIPTDNMSRVADQVKKVRHDYQRDRSRISFQWGIVNEISQFQNNHKLSDEFISTAQHNRLQIEHQLRQETQLIPSFRENMPLSTIILDLKKPSEELFSEMSSESKNHIRKAINHKIDFCIAEEKDYEEFYEKRISIAGFKGFNTISKTTYYKLMNYLKEEKCGNLFIAKKDGAILGGSIMVHDKQTITYLYGFSTRENQYRNMGIHKFIKYKICERAKTQGLEYMDLFGGAPTGFPIHSLTNVSKFKESLGGKKVERYGNYDIILNSYLYKVFQFYHGLKKN